MQTKKGIAGRLASLALALTLVVGGIAPAVALVAATPQQALAKIAIKASSLKVSKKTVKKNKKLTFTMTITGNPADVRLNLQPKGTGSMQWIDVQLKKVSGNKYKGSIKVTNAWKKGKWIVGSVYCYDEQSGDGYMWYNKTLHVPKPEKSVNLNRGNFTVKGTKGDTKAPSVTVKSAKYGTANADGEFSVSMKATDNRAGVNFISLEYVTPQGESFYVQLDKKSGKKMTGKAYTYDQPAGTYKLKSIYVTDKVGNSKVLLDTRYKKERNKGYPGATVKSLKAGDFTLK